MMIFIKRETTRYGTVAHKRRINNKVCYEYENQQWVAELLSASINYISIELIGPKSNKGDDDLGVLKLVAR